MEVKYALMTLLKIVISTPTILLLCQISGTDEAALLGGSTNRSTSDAYYDYDLTDSQELGDHDYDHSKSTKTATEEIPDPSPLVLPGYNLPENIFNHGKPFYVEKDPLTGKIDFSQKSPSPKLDDDLYDYVDEEPSHNIYDKSNIDRKDGSLSSHKHSDVNQLTPNFHDFLNLPVKYNSAKYVYPLISSSYASTKIQGSVNKFHNHKDYATKTTTYKPTVSPTYYSTSQYFSPVQTTTRTTSTTTTTPRPTTTKVVPEIHITTKPTNLLNTEMGHPNFMEDFEDYYDTPTTTTKKHKPSEVYLTTENVNHIYLTTKAPATTTKKPMSLFEQLFGEYDDTVVPAQSTTTARPSLFSNLPSNKYNKYPKTEKPATTTTKSTTTRSTTVTTTESIHNSHGGPNVLVGNMGLESNYEYEDYGNEKYEDNIAVQTKPIVDIDDDLKIEPLHPIKPEKVANPNTEVVVPQNNTDYYDYSEDKETTPISITTPAVSTTTSTATTVRVTSLPLGDNHLTTPSLNHFTTPSLNHFTAPTHNHFTTPSYEQAFNRDPIIVATQNLREKLNSERVQPKPFEKPATPPSTTNVHIAHDQDIVSFVVGNQQNVDGGQYDGPQKESSYGSNPFRPLYGQQGSYMNSDSGYYKLEAEPEVTFQLQQPVAPAQSRPEVVGSAVTIQPLKHSEASLAIGVPVNSVKQVPGQVVDEKLDIDKTVEFPKTTGTKIVFPNEKEPEIPDLLPPPVLSNREVLQLNSKPMYHQLPSDLTPPREPEMVPPPRPDQRPSRPPWDPRPGHFYSGKPEYNRPPRPPSDVAYKRIDNLPNILPQFRPNMNKPPGMFYDKRLNRQPLLERPSNRPIAFFEKLQPPPPPPPIFLQNKNLHALRKNIAPPRQSLDDAPIAEDRIMNEGARRPIQPQDPFGFYQVPPQVRIANRRNGDEDVEVETLQMIQSKNVEKQDNDDVLVKQAVNIPAEENSKGNTEKSIYKVYPVNTPPIKLDVIENNKKESVVIGTRAEPPLPPSKINTEFQNPLFDPKDRNDAPVLKPHPRPSTYPIKSDFPYPLERPDSSMNHPAVPETPSKNGNDLEEPDYFSNNQWNTIGENIESRIVTGHKVNAPNQISVTLKTYTEKPIAVAYTPTEPNLNADKYSMPNYGSPVIPEIRFDAEDSTRTGGGTNAFANNGNKVFTVSATMHTHAQHGAVGSVHEEDDSANDRLDADVPNHPKLDFQAPFQASVNADSSVPQNQGWAVIVRDKNKTTEVPEVTTMPYATTSEFDIENFKPQLEGGFKPIYNLPADDKTSPRVEVSEREE